MAEKTNRRAALGKIFRGIGAIGVSGVAVGVVAKQNMASELALRPPAALDEKDFIKACVKCGNCVTACPYDTLNLADVSDPISLGTPFFIPRETPCYLCTDVPCVEACPSGALNIRKLYNKNMKFGKVDVEKSRIGVAIVDNNSCVAFWGIQCDACYRVCPLIDKAITLEYERNDRTGKHAFLKPVVHTNECTGCGICEHACITEKSSIMVLPRNVATGKSGEFYMKGWKEIEAERMKSREKQMEQKKAKDQPEDYLNEWEDLFDE